MTTSRIGRFVALLAGVAGLTVSASGCVIESTGGGVCLPYLYVPWQIVQDVAGDPPITCASAGATSVELDVNLQTTAQVCSAGQSGGEFTIPLADAGDYTLDLYLLTSTGMIRSEAHPPTLTVGCADRTFPITLPVIL